MRLSVIGNNQRGKQGFITESQMTNKRLPHQQQQQQRRHQQRQGLSANRNIAGDDEAGRTHRGGVIASTQPKARAHR